MPRTIAATTIGPEESFTLALSVNEVGPAFHVSDAIGAPIRNPTQQAMELFDNGSQQTRIADFQVYQELPVRVGILMAQASPWMAASLTTSRSPANIFRLFKGETDRAFVMRFEVETHLESDWSANPGILADGLRGLALPALGAAAVMFALTRSLKRRLALRLAAATETP